MGLKFQAKNGILKVQSESQAIEEGQRMGRKWGTHLLKVVNEPNLLRGLQALRVGLASGSLRIDNLFHVFLRN